MKQFFSNAKILLIITLLITSAKSDWKNFTGAETAPNIAEIYISDKNITVKLEITFQDIKTFKELVPLEWTKDKSINRPSLEERLDYFSNHTLKMIANGKVLPVQLLLAEGRERVERKSKNAGKINPYTKKIIKSAPKDKHILYVELTYPLRSRPKSLVIVPPLDEDGDLEASIGFVAYHKSVPLTDFRYLSKSSSLTLDWDDPWYSKFENKNLSRHHKYPLMVYLYVEPRLVRLESLMRIEDISKITSFDQKNQIFSLLKEHVKRYFKRDKKLHIEGHAVAPDQVDVSFFRVGLSGLELLENIDEKDISSLLIGVSQQYYVDKLPKRIGSTWGYFNDKMEDIPFVATDPKGPYPGFIYKDDPTFQWINYIKDTSEPQIIPVEVKTGKRLNLPLLGDIKIWSELPDENQSKSIIEKTFTNLQTAFIEKEDEHLEKEVKKIVRSDDNLLKQELAQLFSPSIVRGGKGSIRAFGEIKIDNIRALKEAVGFSASLSGSALVTAYHWGHNDNVVLKYKVLMDFVEENGKWFIRNFSLLDLKDA